MTSPYQQQQQRLQALADYRDAELIHTRIHIMAKHIRSLQLERAAGTPPSATLPRCDCINHCGDDLRVGQHQATPCDAERARMAFQARVNHTRDRLQASHGHTAGGRLAASLSPALQIAIDNSTDAPAFWAELLAALGELAGYSAANATKAPDAINPAGTTT